jgi:3-methyladenine DNA glycosylase AlkD
MQQLNEVIGLLKEMAKPQYLAGMSRFGIGTNTNPLGVKVPDLRKLAKTIKKDHQLALQLWDSNIHEARVLASLVADPAQVTPQLMDSWVHEFASWDICDQACGNLFDSTPFALDKALEYSKAEPEYVKRASFVLMAEFAVHDKKATDDKFLALLPVIERESWDDRNFVKKAVNWALRQIGKRNSLLRHAAIVTAERILEQDTKAARWIAKDALRELWE